MALYHTYTDEELLKLLQEGDHTAFASIFDRYWNLLFSLAVKQLGDPYEAEEVVQEIFTEVWARRAGVKITCSLNYWLAAAVKYKTLTIFSNRHRRLLLTGDLPEDTLSETALPYSLIEMQQLMAQLESVVAALPERPRVIYRLSREEHLSNREIARQLQISEKTVENHMNRALSSLRKTFGDAALSLVLFLL